MPLKNAILKLDELAKIMRLKRMKDGAISFDKAEVKFNLDEANNPVVFFLKHPKMPINLLKSLCY